MNRPGERRPRRGPWRDPLAWFGLAWALAALAFLAARSM